MSTTISMENSEEKMIDFYNMKKRERVKIPVRLVKKVTYEKINNTGFKHTKYAVEGIDDGTIILRFLKKKDFDKISGPIEKR